MFKHDFGPHRERMYAYSQERVDDIKRYGLRWAWDKQAGTDFECFKWSLDYACKYAIGGIQLNQDEVLKKEDTYWGPRYSIVYREDGSLKRRYSVILFGTFEMYAGPGMKGKTLDIKVKR